MKEEAKSKMLKRLKDDLSVNFKTGDDSILSDFIDDYISIDGDRTESDSATRVAEDQCCVK